MDSLYNKVIGPFQVLSELLTLPGAIAGILLSLVIMLLLVATPKGRIVLVVSTIGAFVLTQTISRSSSVGLPAFITVSATNLRWLFLIPFCLIGIFFLLTGEGMKIGSFLMLLPLFIYLLACSFFSTGLARYLLWIFMWIGMISATVQLISKLGIEKIMKYWLVLSYILLGLNLMVTIFRPGKAFLGMRYCGMMANPNAYGFVVMIVLFPLLWAIFEKKKKNPLNYAILIFLVVTLLMSGSRAAALSLMPIILCVLFMYIKRPGLMILMGIMSIIIIASTAYIANPEVVSRFLSTDSSGRVEMWEYLWPIITSAPFGNGIGWIEQNMAYPPHNSYLYMATEAGYFWAIVFFATMFGISIHGGFRRKYYETRESYRMKILLLSLIAGIISTGMFESWLIGIGGFHLPFFLFAIGLKEGLLAYQKEKYANPIEAQYQIGDDSYAYMPVLLTGQDYYLKRI